MIKSQSRELFRDSTCGEYIEVAVFGLMAFVAGAYLVYDAVTRDLPFRVDEGHLVKIAENSQPGN